MFSITFQILFISITLLGLENTMLKFPDTSMTVGSVYVDSGTSCLVNHRHCVPHTIVPSSTFPNHKHHVILLIFYSSDIFIYPTFYIHLNSTSTRTLTSVCANQLHIVPVRAAQSTVSPYQSKETPYLSSPSTALLSTNLLKSRSSSCAAVISLMSKPELGLTEGFV